MADKLSMQRIKHMSNTIESYDRLQDTLSDVKNALKGNEMEIYFDHYQIYHPKTSDIFNTFRLNDYEIENIKKILHGAWDRAKLEMEMDMEAMGIETKPAQVQVFYHEANTGPITIKNTIGGSSANIVWAGTSLEVVKVNNSPKEILKDSNIYLDATKDLVSR